MKTSSCAIVQWQRITNFTNWERSGLTLVGPWGRVVGGAERHGLLGKQGDVMTVWDPMRAIFPDPGKSWFESRIPL